MNIEAQQILTQIVGFLVLLWGLKKLAWKPLLRVLDERKERISSEFNEIDLSKQECARLQREYEARLAEADSQVRMRIQEAIQEGQRAAKEIQERVKEESQQMLRQAQEEIERQREKAMQELQANMADLVTAVASKVIGKSLTQKDHLKLLDQFISEVKDQYGR